MKTILVPTDYSRCSHNAIDYAVMIAKRTKAEIVLVHVYTMTSPPPELSEISYLFSLNKKQEEQLERIVKLYQLIHDDFKELKMRYDLRMGDTVNEIIKAAEFYKAGMIIMGTGGASGLGKYILGSNTIKVINKTKVPVLAVPLTAKFLGFNKIVFAVNAHVWRDNLVFDALAEIAVLFKSQIKIVSVQAGDEDMVHYFDSFEETGVVEIFKKLKLQCEFKKIFSKDIATGIHDFVLQDHADLLITMPGKHGFLEHLFNKSITRELVFQNDMPVLALPQK